MGQKLKGESRRVIPLSHIDIYITLLLTIYPFVQCSAVQGCFFSYREPVIWSWISTPNGSRLESEEGQEKGGRKTHALLGECEELFFCHPRHFGAHSRSNLFLRKEKPTIKLISPQRKSHEDFKMSSHSSEDLLQPGHVIKERWKVVSLLRRVTFDVGHMQHGWGLTIHSTLSRANTLMVFLLKFRGWICCCCGFKYA